MKSITLLLMMALLSSCAMGIKSIPATEVENKYANPQDHSQFITVRETRVHYRDQGKKDGEVLVLLHGIISSLHTWDGWVKELESDYRIVRIDIPGFGLTGPLKENEYTIENYVAFLEEFLKVLNIEKFHMAGNSLGGFIAWNYAVKHPTLVKKLILLDPAGYPFDPPWIVQVAALPGVSQTAQLVSPRFMAEWTLKDIYGDKHNPSQETVDRYYEIFLKEGNREMAAKVFLDLLKYRNYDPKEIKNITTPTFIMWGEQDTFVPVEQHKLWMKDLPTAKVKLYEGIGHIPMEESPKLTARDAKEFLSI